ncbi:MAG: tetratricopeptide repeat protein, partial [Flavobacteriales bacterium]|nr:tetratricopeptide repeat protein [Flavobacteriales bacterium]
VIEVAKASDYGSEAHKGGHVNLGFTQSKKGDHASAIENYNTCLKLIDEFGSGQVDIYVYNFLGSSYNILNEFEQAEYYFQKAIDRAEEIGDIGASASPISNIGSIHEEQNDLLKARDMYRRAYELMKDAGQLAGALQPLTNLATLDLREGRLDSARSRYQRVVKGSLIFKDRDQEGHGLLGLGRVDKQLGLNSEAIRNLFLARDIGYEIGEIYLISEAAEQLSEIYSESNDFKRAMDYYSEHILFRDSIDSQKNKRAALRQEFRYTYDKKALEDSLEFARIQLVKDIEIERQQGSLSRQRIGLMAAGGGLVLLFLLVHTSRRGKKRSDELLSNILPAEVIQEVKVKGHAEARSMEAVTVLFTDFKGFTAMSELLSPRELVQDLDACFSEFDRITVKYGIEKIKTIGDSYMAAGGIPVPSPRHAADVLSAAIEMRDFVAAGKERKKEAGLPYFEVRIGMHSGPVVAGIVGFKKYSYDIWGDTVNIASRMESHGTVNRINISRATFELLKDDPRFSFEYRGTVEAKGKGMLEMWYADRAT